MSCCVPVTLTAAVQTAGGEKGEEGERRRRRREAAARDTVTCKRTHMVLPQRSTQHRDSPKKPPALLQAPFFPQNKQFSVFISPSFPPPRIFPSSRSPLSVGLGPVKQRHGSGERRRRQRGDVEKASGRHQEDIRF